MDDAEIRDRIESLEDEERRLRAGEEDAAQRGRADELADGRRRLAEIKVELDQLWDLLRQRAALRRSGQDPDSAQMRDARTVEDYLG